VGIGSSGRTNGGVVEQTVQPMNGMDPRFGLVNVSYAPREESECAEIFCQFEMHVCQKKNM
jgi:hypothetical protein